jgi:hypothetical protein
MTRMDWEGARARQEPPERPVRGRSWRDLPATAKQLRWLHGEHLATWGREWFEPRGLTRGQASDLIARWKRDTELARAAATAESAKRGHRQSPT